ncbi:hypothetical protein BV375_35765 [Nostoc sp. 106C]|nr:hypothetical protein BV375_35765 [Nostoc sp. 106C]
MCLFACLFFAANDRSSVAQTTLDRRIPKSDRSENSAPADNQKQQFQHLIDIGNTYITKKQYPQAVDAFQQALAIARNLHDPKAQIRAFNRLGYSYQLLGSDRREAGANKDALAAFKKSLEARQQAYRLAQQIQDRQAEGWAMEAIGLNYLFQAETLIDAGAYQDALKVSQQSLEPLQQAQIIGRNLKDANLESQAISNISFAYGDIGTALGRLNQPNEALKAEQQALAVVRENRDRLTTENPLKLEVGKLQQIASYYNDLGQTEKAITNYREALAIQRQLGDNPAEEAMILQLLAGIYETRSEYSQALESAQQALAIVRQQLKNPAQEARLMPLLGIIYSDLGKFATAVQQYEQGLAIAKHIGDANMESAFLGNLGDIYAQQGQYLRALEYRQQALAIVDEALHGIEAQDNKAMQRFCSYLPGISANSYSQYERDMCLQSARTAKATALNNVGGSYSHVGRYAEAMKQHQEALAIARSLGDREREVATLNNIGFVYLNTGDYAKALSSFQQVLEILTVLGNRFQQSLTLNNIGYAYQEQGDYNKSLEYRQKALKIAQQINARGAEATTLDNIGVIYGYQGDHRRALEYFQQALKISESLGIKPINELGNIGFFYENQGDFAKALEHYQRALALAKENGDRKNEAVLLGKLANVDWSQGRYALSLEKRQQAQKIYEEMGARPDEAEVLVWLGRSYRTLGQYDRALEILQQARKLGQEIGSRRPQANALTQIGNIYHEQKRYAEAMENHQQALAMQQEMGELLSVSKTLTSIGSDRVQQGQFTQAMDSFQQALLIQTSIGVRPDQGITLRELGLAYAAQDKLPQAIETLQQALEIHRSVSDREQEGITLSELGEVLLKNKQPQAAETALSSAVEILDVLRSGLGDRENVSLFDTQTKTYRLLQQSRIAQNKTDAALEAAERGRARAFVELLSKRLTSADSKNTDTAEIHALNLAQIREIAKAENATLVEYSIINEQTLYIWVVQPSGNITFRKVNLATSEPSQPTQAIAQATRGGFVEPVNNLLATIRRGGVDAQPADSSPSTSHLAFAADPVRMKLQLRQLHEQLIAPIANLLPTNPNQRVIFLPQGPLFLVPFPALLDANNQYLVEQHTILTAPSIQVLELTRKQEHKQDSANSEGNTLIVGNPTMPSIVQEPGKSAEPLPSLPGAESEASAIAQLFHTDFLTGDRATKATVLQRMSTARMVHLATHGLLNDFNGLGVPGAIALAPAGKDNGLLTADEILDLKLQAELVVLSACDTGRGRVTGDGVIGLSRSLISAGVPSVIVSLWSVPDAPTADLMMAFYQHLKTNPDKAQALRQAMLIVKKQYPNPIAWAAFTLIGESE